MGLGFRSRLGLGATAVSTCAAVVLGMGFGGSGLAAQASPQAAKEAKRVTVRFFTALDQGRWNQACSLLAREFYRRHHVPDKRHCIVGFTIGMSGTAVRYRIGRVEAKGDKVVVHAVVDGAPGTVQLVKEKRRGYRVIELQATPS